LNTCYVGRQGKERADAGEPWQLEGREGKLTTVLLGGGARPSSLDLRSREEDGGGGVGKGGGRVGKVGGGAQPRRRRRRREAAVSGLAEGGEGGRRRVRERGRRSGARGKMLRAEYHAMSRRDARLSGEGLAS
jgi:hypothetical protein